MNTHPLYLIFIIIFKSLNKSSCRLSNSVSMDLTSKAAFSPDNNYSLQVNKDANRNVQNTLILIHLEK